jgi:malonyl-CoA O-methyltransferase
MKISSEFSKYAKEYNSYNIIQNKVVHKLLSKITSQPQNILDLGCGSGALCKAIDWEYEHFLGVDFASNMLELHPKSQKIECVFGDFNNEIVFQNLSNYNFDYIFSASALQWAKNLDGVLQNIAALKLPIAVAIFTAGTFKTLYESANLEPILRDSQTVEALSAKYFDLNSELVNYSLEFNTTREMFRYIKKSGVSGSRNVLSYKQTKQLMQEYPLNYLEFEVVFLTSR